MVTKFVKEEHIKQVIIGIVIIMLLLHTDDVVVFVNTFEDAQKLLEVFGKHVKMGVKGSKRKIILVKSQNNEKPFIIYNN